MNYITLTREVFFGKDGKPSMEYLSQYCQSLTTEKVIYKGHIDVRYYGNLVFPNIVKCHGIDSKDIVKQFPDLEEVVNMYYYPDNIPDINNLKSADYLRIHFPSNTNVTMQFIREHIDIINNNTLIINGKELKINYNWKISFVEGYNYREFGYKSHD